DRRGKVVSVAIGDSTSVEVAMRDIREKRLSGVRVIHTHPNGFSNLSALDLSALLKLKLDAIMAIGVYEGKVIDCSLGMITITNDLLDYEEKLNLSIDEILSIHILDKIQHIESMIKEKEITEDEGEKAILVGSDTKESLEELSELTKACDIPALDAVFQSRSKVDPAFYIGKGKVLEIASLSQSRHANLI
ncbi:GTPase HflX, partial [Clostridium perfringens]|nr:GTPase HflX [Clostridium perfringens]